MSFVRCSKGEHLYDNTLHTSCPYCPQTDRVVGRNANDNIPETAGSRKNSDYEGYKPVETFAANLKAPDFEGHTQAGLDPAQPAFDPVVGWLVVQSEKGKGRDFRIRNGWNSIGRDSTNRIIVDFDMAVSRKNHAAVLYDNETNSFSVKHGDGVTGTRLNGHMIGDMTPLAPYDVIHIGTTELVFVPLCQERFQWGSSETETGK